MVTGITGREYAIRAYHPGLGRFMSEDPKLFDGGDYNLFRYCANDPLDKSDPMGLEPVAAEHPNLGQNDLAAWVTRVNCNTNQGAQAKNAEPKPIATGQGGAGAGGFIRDKNSPKVEQDRLNEGFKATDDSVAKMNAHPEQHPYGVASYGDASGQHFTDPIKGDKIGSALGRDRFREDYTKTVPEGATVRIIGHGHQKGNSSFSPLDGQAGNHYPVMKNHEARRGREPGRDGYDMYFRGWLFRFNQDHSPNGNASPYTPN